MLARLVLHVRIDFSTNALLLLVVSTQASVSRPIRAELGITAMALKETFQTEGGFTDLFFWL